MRKIDSDDFGIVMFILVHLAGLVFAIWLIYSATKDVNERIEIKKSYIGKQAVVNNDTLTVVGSSLWNDDVTLSNGLKVDERFIIKEEEEGK